MANFTGTHNFTQLSNNERLAFLEDLITAASETAGLVRLNQIARTSQERTALATAATPLVVALQNINYDTYFGTKPD